MDLLLAYSHLRQRIGNPTINDVPNHQLASVLEGVLETLAQRWRSVIRTDEHSLDLAEDQSEYPLPQDFAWLLWVEHNEKKLEPSSTFKWDRDGIDWRHAESATPREYALQGRSIILYPPPDDDAITDDGAMTFRYVATEPEVTDSGVEAFGDADMWVAIWWAAVTWLGLHPGDTPEKMQSRLLVAQAADRELNLMLPDADRRHENPSQEYHRRFKLGGRRWRPAR